jgi:hypothetical protein
VGPIPIRVAPQSGAKTLVYELLTNCVLSRRFGVLCLLVLNAPASFSQQTALPDPTLQQPQPPPPAPQHKRIFGIIPNYRTYPTLKDYKPISSRQKFDIFAQDTFDRGSFVLAGAFAGKGFIANDTPSFGHGVEGFSKYYAAGYGDVAIGNFMTEALYPVMLHQDPRFFRRGTGSGWSRAGYAVKQIFWTRSDHNHMQFNYSEVAGNLTAAGIATAYYPDNRSVGAVASIWGIQIGIDMAGNLLKEFWPDLDRKLSRKHHAENP